MFQRRTGEGIAGQEKLSDQTDVFAGRSGFKTVNTLFKLITLEQHIIVFQIFQRDLQYDLFFFTGSEFDALEGFQFPQRTGDPALRKRDIDLNGLSPLPLTVIPHKQ